MAVLLVLLLAGPAQAGKIAFPADLFFAENSAQLEVRYLERLDVQACKAVPYGLELVVVSAHASSNERDPQGLSERRAAAVQQYLQALTGKPVEAEAKGATQPVADPKTPTGQAKNRRVEVEMVFQIPDQRPGPEREPCRPQWVKHLLANASTAPVVAKAWIRDYRLAATAPFEVALREKRPDIFAALVQDGGIALSHQQHSQVAQAALDAGELDYALAWVRQNQANLKAKQRNPLLLAVCQSPAAESVKLRATQTLYQLGARSLDAAPLECAVKQGLPGLVAWYLQNDGPRFVTPEAVVAAGPHPQVLQQLLATGADIRARSSNGSSLFFSTRLNSVADAQRLLDAGLDINARQKDGDTPILLALGYAPLEVLQWMREQGATVPALQGLNAARQRPEVQIWLLASGVQVPPEQLALVLGLLQERGDDALPVFQALQAQGAFVWDSAAGRQALAQAISRWQVALVRFFVNAGVGDEAVRLEHDKQALTPLERVEALDIYRRWRPCISSVPAKWCPPEHEPMLDTNLAQKKTQILEILRPTGSAAVVRH
ncbi:OmpA family protein [Comamonas sp. J-3]|uniref:OmpA family protein n=1 Tax=Comamonas trifloxystrobinivorans TaxID=3350256 RepID=UPI00372BEC4D